MRVYQHLFTIGLLILVTSVYGQAHSDLFEKADSIMRYELKFNVDSSIAEGHKGQQTLKVRDADPPPEFPLTVIDGVIVTREQLDSYQIKSIKRIRVMQRSEAIKYYGSQGVYGVIYITTDIRQR